MPPGSHRAQVTVPWEASRARGLSARGRAVVLSGAGPEDADGAVGR